MVNIYFSHKEELWNAWSHAFGAVAGGAAGLLMLSWCVQSGDVWATVGLSLYLFGMLSSYLSSTLYHSLSAWSVWKERLRKLDHAAIYWHIAGSYSPMTLVALRHAGAWGWGLTAFIWAAAVAGTVVSFRRLSGHSRIETVCFVVMGMSILVAFGPLYGRVGAAVIGCIVAEGVSYVTGAVFYCLNHRRYMHTVFHFFVLLGTAFHIAAVAGMLARFLPQTALPSWLGL